MRVSVNGNGSDTKTFQDTNPQRFLIAAQALTSGTPADFDASQVNVSFSVNRSDQQVTVFNYRLDVLAAISDPGSQEGTQSIVGLYKFVGYVIEGPCPYNLRGTDQATISVTNSGNADWTVSMQVEDGTGVEFYSWKINVVEVDTTRANPTYALGDFVTKVYAVNAVSDNARIRGCNLRSKIWNCDYDWLALYAKFSAQYASDPTLGWQNYPIYNGLPTYGATCSLTVLTGATGGAAFFVWMSGEQTDRQRALAKTTYDKIVAFNSVALNV